MEPPECYCPTIVHELMFDMIEAIEERFNQGRAPWHDLRAIHQMIFENETDEDEMYIQEIYEEQKHYKSLHLHAHRDIIVRSSLKEIACKASFRFILFPLEIMENGDGLQTTETCIKIMPYNSTLPFIDLMPDEHVELFWGQIKELAEVAYGDMFTFQEEEEGFFDDD